ncbi:MAG: flagellar basal body-associated FliL family protein [Thermodesulfobacteriota bacterium]
MSESDTRGDKIFSGTREEQDYLEDEAFTGEDQFMGNELDEETVAESQSISGEETSSAAKTQVKRKRLLWLGIAGITCASAGLAYLLLTHEYLAKPPAEENIVQRQLTLPLSNHKRVDFHSLVIPFDVSEGFTYLSFRISFYVPNNKVRDEIENKKVRLTGIIYDAVTQEVNIGCEIPPLQTLKELILRKVNSLLTTGRVKKVYITKFLAI